MLKKQVIQEDELSNIAFDKKTGLYSPHFHVTVLRATTKPIDASLLFRDFGEYELGKMQIAKVQLCSRLELQDSKQRMKRELWRELKDHNATYAVETEIYLSFDPMF